KNKKIIALIISFLIISFQNNINALEKNNTFKNNLIQQENLKLKDNIIDVLGFSNQKKLSIGFDTEKKEFKVYNQENRMIHEFKSMLNKKYFVIKILNKNGDEKLNIELLGKDLGTTDKLNTLKNFKYEYGDFIKLGHIEARGRLKIYGGVIDEKEDYSNGVGNLNNLNNVLFEITKDGLKAIYIKPPLINGINDVTVRQGTSFDLLKGITVVDFLNNDITNKISINGNIDKDTLGDYNIKYDVTDKFGISSEGRRKITIIEKSKLEENTINTCGVFWANPEFKIGFDDFKKEFKVFDQTSNVMHRGFGSIDFWSIRILNSNGEEKFLLKLKGTDNANSNKLESLKGFTYEYGDIIELWHKEPSKERIDGNIINAKHSYKDRIESSDNVKFEILKEGLKAIYDESPTITGIENVTLKIGEDFDSLSGVSAADDIDENLVVNVVGNVETNNVGQYELTYTSKGKFGKTTTKKRVITVRDLTDLEKNTINIKNNKNNLLLGIKFNEDSKSINLIKHNTNERFNDKIGDFIKIKIYNSEEVEKLSINILGEDKVTSSKLDDLQNFKFEYGDTVEFLQYDINENNNINIEGIVTGSKSDYSKGIDKNILNNSKFKITKTGLQ
ncbi:MAG: immunoglobulin-like domain-containing protein, partial [Sarcina sp.]